MKSLERQIIELLIFPESFEHILAEVSESNPNVVADELKQLIVRSLVTPVKPEDNDAGFIYDSDNMKLYRYRLTGAGIEMLEKQKTDGEK